MAFLNILGKKDQGTGGLTKVHYDRLLSRKVREVDHMAVQDVIIAILNTKHTGVTPGLAESYHEAARVCLDRHHSPPVEIAIEVDQAELAGRITWEKATDVLKAGWANSNDATEYGACAIAIAAVELATGLVAVGRAHTGTGADYFLAPPGAVIDDLEGCYRLEISGVDKGSRTILAGRLLRKKAQAAEGNSDLPAIATVVGFQARLILGSTVERI